MSEELKNSDNQAEETKAEEVKTEEVKTEEVKAEEVKPEPAKEPEAPKKKSKAGLIIGIIAAVVVIGGGAGAGVWWMTTGSPDAKYSKAMEEAAACVANEDYDEAVALYENAYEIKPENSEPMQAITDLYLTRAKEAVKEEDYETALDILEEGIDKTDADELKDSKDKTEEEYEEWKYNKALEAQNSAATEERYDYSDGTYAVSGYNENGRLVKRTYYNADDSLYSYLENSYDVDGIIQDSHSYFADGVCSSYKIYEYDEKGTAVKANYYDKDEELSGYSIPIEIADNGLWTKYTYYEIEDGEETGDYSENEVSKDDWLTYSKWVQKDEWAEYRYEYGTYERADHFSTENDELMYATIVESKYPNNDLEKYTCEYFDDRKGSIGYAEKDRFSDWAAWKQVNEDGSGYQNFYNDGELYFEEVYNTDGEVIWEVNILENKNDLAVKYTIDYKNGEHGWDKSVHDEYEKWDNGNFKYLKWVHEDGSYIEEDRDEDGKSLGSREYNKDGKLVQEW